MSHLSGLGEELSGLGDWIPVFLPCAMCAAPHGQPHVPGCMIRGAAGWENLVSGTSGQAFVSNGAGADGNFVARKPGEHELALREYLHQNWAFTDRDMSPLGVEAMCDLAVMALRKMRVAVDEANKALEAQNKSTKFTVGERVWLRDGTGPFVAVRLGMGLNGTKSDGTIDEARCWTKQAVAQVANPDGTMPDLAYDNFTTWTGGWVLQALLTNAEPEPSEPPAMPWWRECPLQAAVAFASLACGVSAVVVALAHLSPALW